MIVVYTDGAMDGEGWSGVGIVLHSENNVQEHRIPIGRKKLNQEAEFEAVVRALRMCAQKFPGEILSFRLDARIVVDVMEKNFTKNKTFQPYVKEIQQLSSTFPHIFVKWIPQTDNQQADRLAKQAIHLNEAQK